MLIRYRKLIIVGLVSLLVIGAVYFGVDLWHQRTSLIDAADSGGEGA